MLEKVFRKRGKSIIKEFFKEFEIVKINMERCRSGWTELSLKIVYYNSGNVGSNPTLSPKRCLLWLDNGEKIKWFITMGFIITSFIIVVALMIVYHYDGEMKCHL